MRKFDWRLFVRRKIMKSKITSDELLDNLRKGGARIGRDVIVYSTGRTWIDQSAPWLLTIGDHVRITEGVRILSHDYAWSVLKWHESEDIAPGRVLGAQSPVDIGSHVFIGMNSVIMRGVKIGDHVVIGAGSVVTKDCPSGGVYAGNPARYIMSISAFYRKREALQFAEAKEVARRYRQRLGKEPPMEIFTEYFMLFADSDTAASVPVFRAQMGRVGNYEAAVQYMQSHPPMFPDYESFLKACWQDDSEMETSE